MAKYHYLYKTTNLKNNFIYIGKHETDDLEDGYMGSGSRLRQAIMEFGEENFITEILIFLQSSEELLLLERCVVNKEFLKRKDVYNVSIGGSGVNIGQGYKFNCPRVVYPQKVVNYTMGNNVQIDIINMVSLYYGIDKEKIFEHDRRMENIEPRQVCMVALQDIGMTLTGIGLLLNKTHATVIHGIEEIKDNINHERIQCVLKLIKNKIKPQIYSKINNVDSNISPMERKMSKLMQDIISKYPEKFYCYFYAKVLEFQKENKELYNKILENY